MRPVGGGAQSERPASCLVIIGHEFRTDFITCVQCPHKELRKAAAACRLVHATAASVPHQLATYARMAQAKNQFTQ